MQFAHSLLRALPAVALLPLLAACDDTAASSPKVERPVQVERVEFRPAEAAREFVGVVRARHETDVGFRVAGKITARLVNMGDRVRAGDAVAQLDPADLKLQVESAQAELLAARSNLAQATSDATRYDTLRSRGYATVADYERKQAAKDEAQGRLERAQRALDLARNQLAYAELKADVDGVITAAPVEPGQVVAVGQAVVRLAHHGEMEGSSRCRKPRSAKRANRRPASVCGQGRNAATGRICASCRRRPTRRPAPMRRGSPSRTPTTSSRSE